MIIDFKENFNTYNDNILGKYNVFEYVCPSCGAKHSLIRHGKYTRNICFINESNLVEEKSMVVLRLICKSCNTTHAILPNDVVPYCIYSFSFMLNTLIRRFVDSSKISTICNDFNISFQLLYTFIKRFLKFAESCMLVLRNLGFQNSSTDISKLLLSIIAFEKSDKDFFFAYFLCSSWIFLMTKFQNNLSPPIFLGGFAQAFS